MPEEPEEEAMTEPNDTPRRLFNASEKKDSGLPEVEEVRLRINGEADSLEKALVADEVRTLPVGTQEDCSLNVQGITLIGMESERNPI
jgi:hypothetical protein